MAARAVAAASEVLAEVGPAQARVLAPLRELEVLALALAVLLQVLVPAQLQVEQAALVLRVPARARVLALPVVALEALVRLVVESAAPVVLLLSRQ